MRVPNNTAFFPIPILGRSGKCSQVKIWVNRDMWKQGGSFETRTHPWRVLYPQRTPLAEARVMDKESLATKAELIFCLLCEIGHCYFQKKASNCFFKALQTFYSWIALWENLLIKYCLDDNYALVNGKRIKQLFLGFDYHAGLRWSWTFHTKVQKI